MINDNSAQEAKLAELSKTVQALATKIDGAGGADGAPGEAGGADSAPGGAGTGAGGDPTSPLNDMFAKIDAKVAVMNGGADGTTPGVGGAAGGAPSPFVGGELAKLEELIGSLNYKIDKVESRVDSPGQLERLSMMNTMGGTFGELQNTIENLQSKITNGLQPKLPLGV